MIEEAALPTAPEATAGVQVEQPAAEPKDTQVDSTTETGDQPEQAEKKEKTPEQREIDRLRRALDRKTRQREEARAELAHVRGQPRHETGAQTQDDDQPVSLTRKELDALITERAAKLAPTIKQEEAVIEQRRGVVQGLAKEWGQEKFDAYASELDDAFGGLVGRDGKPKPATDAIFESDMPRALIEYLADPENAEEAEALGRLSATQAARAVTKLEIKLEAAQKEAKAKAKPQPSGAAPPIEPVRGAGSASDMPDPSDTKAYMKWANEQDRRK